MPKNDAIINPVKSKNAPAIGPVAVMAATPTDLFTICDLLNFTRDDFQRLMISRVYIDKSQPEGVSLTGPFVGAPYAVMLMETLVAWGARKILFMGWCGAVAEKVKIGDIILPTAAVIDEGTSAHYETMDNERSCACPSMVSAIRNFLVEKQVDFHAGEIWTTDAVYRETRQQVETHQRNGILAVEMELSALFTAARYRRVSLAGILVVSDELSLMKWRPGFKDEGFHKGRRTACRMVKELCPTLITK